MLAEHQAAVAGGVFLAAYAFIVSEKLHRTLVAISGAVVLILLGVLTQQQAIAAIDFGTIGLLIGMMIIVAVARRSGVFEYAAIRAVKSTGGDPRRMLVVLGAVTALASALLDNVTTVLLIAPVTFSIADELDIDVIPFLFTEIMASNIGGTATLVGDPPNIMIGSATGLGFVDFLVNLGPAV
ncbi:MAG: SLC13 family permease, partial [Syntrophomonadaceae bacterium]|nr:SLC13 family permease [Syntrophomonadaceae bacterium]